MISMSQGRDKKNICVPNRIRTYDLPNIASRADVLRGSSRVSAGTRDEPLRTSATHFTHHYFFKQKGMAML